MALLGFMSATFAPDIQHAVEAEKPKATMPEFKRKWWYRRDCLDARATIWSLENRPEEWEANPLYWPGYVRHVPSDHIYSQHGNLIAHECGCSGYPFQRGQQARLAKAVRAFIARQTAITQHQYQSHFLGK